MTVWRVFRSCLLFSWRLLRAIVSGVRKQFSAARAWVLCILVVIGALVVYYSLSDRYAPLTTDAYVQAYVIQVAPQVEGQVVRVSVCEGQAVSKGELLFEIDPRPFEHRVALLEAKLVQTRQQVAQLESDLAASRADDTRIVAEEAYARAVHTQEKQIFGKDATTERKYLDALQKSRVALAAVARSGALTRKAEQALAARVGNEHALVAEVQALLAEAQLNLAYSKVVAPCDGVITNLQLRDGAYAHVGQAVLACIDTGQWLVVGNFREKSLEQMRAGQPALVALQAAPGQLQPARVRWVGWGVAQAQGVPSGLLPDVKNQTSWLPPGQRFQVRLVLEEPGAVPLRVGMTASVSVYPEPEGFLNDLTEAVHRLIAWLYYL